MFTPPPSPDPYRTKHSLSPEPPSIDDNGFLAVPSSTIPSCLSKEESAAREDLRHQRKLQTGRRIRWTILLVPAILIFITASTRYISHLTGLSSQWSLDSESVHSSEWLHLKREPNPEPVPLPQQSSGSSGSTSSSSATQTVPTIPATPPQLPTPFPQPLDQSLSTNFSTQGCENFFLNMTSSTAFRTCRPFSLLFQTSSDFVLAQTNLTALNNIMWGTCNTNTDAAQCSANMAWFAQDLQQECAEDVKDNNAVVMQTLKGLQTYDLYRTTACLADQSTNAYCYVEAVHNTSPADLYFYSLPLGTQLPSTVQPTCSACMKSVMGIFAKSVSNNSALEHVYNGAATIANNACGAGFVTITSANAGVRVELSRGYAMIFATIVVSLASGLVLW